MPISDPRTGSLYICLVSTILLLSVLSGGILLAIYMIRPVSQPWVPVAGVSLVCFPWFFWFLTFLYRVISRRCCGPRSAVADPGSSAAASRSGKASCEKGATVHGSAEAAEDGGASEGPESPVDGSPDGGARRVRFGGAVVVGNPNLADNGVGGGGGGGGSGSDEASKNHDRSPDAENSVASHESEIPLTLSMAS